MSASPTPSIWRRSPSAWPSLGLETDSAGSTPRCPTSRRSRAGSCSSALTRHLSPSPRGTITRAGSVSVSGAASSASAYSPILYQDARTRPSRASGHGLTDLVKRSTRSASELSRDELEAGVDGLQAKVRAWQPGLILFAFKEPARVLFGPSVKPGVGPELEGVRTFLLTGPYAPTDDARRIDAELEELLGAEASGSSDYEPTQRVTAKDLEQGQIRLKQPARRFFPSGKERIEILLRGERLEASYDPKLGPDRPRSPLLRIERRRLRNAVQPNEQLRVSRGLAGVIRID